MGQDTLDAKPAERKRPPPLSDPRYPRKRSVKACHVCRARKTKCDNVQPTCGFCASLNIPCSYDAVEKDHSSFDPASLEILRQLGHVIQSQEHVLQMVRSVAASSQAQPPVTGASSSSDTAAWDALADGQSQQRLPSCQSESKSPAASASVAAARWFGLLASDASAQETHVPLGTEAGFLGPADDDAMTPLQRATRIIDSQTLPDAGLSPDELPEESRWQAPDSISLLPREQALFDNFLHRICSWLDLFDPARTFSTKVPHLAVRNAGLLNAILALSDYHQSRAASRSALQYYYQTLHYVQKAMRYASYQNSRELMATTLVVSTYEMLRGSRQDWQQHLQGVFWILRSRQIEVEVPSLESTTWWAWLRQDIWVAFRERRRTYSTWSPKKAYAELSSHELASRAVWIMAQVVNYCAVESEEATLAHRRAWAEALRKMLAEWRLHLTVEFTPLPAAACHDPQVFQPRMIHPQCFGKCNFIGEQ